MRATGAPSRPRAGAIDLGSTRVKAALLDARGRLVGLRGLDAPPLAGDGRRRECDAEAYAAVADALLRWLAGELPRGFPLGLAAQRSSFLLWERGSSRPLTPLVSWQDRRAAAWCARHAALEPEVVRRTGLVLSAHYAGPKLASAIADDAGWRGLIDRADCAFGTLDTFLIRRWSAAGEDVTDATMAARTAMYDLERGDWCAALLARYGVPRRLLPELRASCGRDESLRAGPRLAASLADQAAGALTLLDAERPGAVVSLGTGAFVMRRAADPGERVAGYLTAPVLARPDGSSEWVVEGSVNGAGAALDRFGAGPTVLPGSDPHPRAFCLPDAAGLGAPYWRPEVGFALSSAAARLDRAERRRVALEGLLFRVREVLEGLGVGPSRAVLLAGGPSREPAVAEGLAALLGRPLRVLGGHEAVLLGAARLAAGLAPAGSPAVRTVRPGPSGAYLAEKYERWRAWLARRLDQPPATAS